MDTNTPAGASASSDSILQIPVVKGNGTIEVDANKLNMAHYVACLASGIKTMVNGGSTKIVKPDVNDPVAMEKFHAAGMAKAKERLEGMYEGTLTIRGGVKGTHTKASGEHPANVVTEARRLAKATVKAAMKEQGLKITRVPASEITKAANDLLNDADLGPTYYAQAEKNLAEQGKFTAAGDILSKVKVKEDPALIAKEQAAAAAKKAKGAPISAKQAGMTSQTAH